MRHVLWRIMSRELFFMEDESISKLFSLVLRHQPEALNLDMDNHGWVSVDQLITNLKTMKNIEIDLNKIIQIVETNNKKRFILDETQTHIRANQGHSINVDVELQKQNPPDTLFHGTATRFIESIMEKGLLPMNRQYVHLSKNVEIATDVGKRHGKPIVLIIDSKEMAKNGFDFFLSENGVWLVSSVPSKYISLNT
jgi:putative RNA 2'-phosphotransferase